MPRPTIPAPVLKQRGTQITLIDGNELTLLITFSSLVTLESQYGSIADVLTEANGGAASAMNSALLACLAAGLEHAALPDDNDAGDPELLRGWLDSLLIEDYSNAVGECFEKSFPLLVKGADDGSDPTQQAPGSLGSSGDTSVSSSSDAARESSGP